jgi:hypothetical protein
MKSNIESTRDTSASYEIAVIDDTLVEHGCSQGDEVVTSRCVGCTGARTDYPGVGE